MEKSRWSEVRFRYRHLIFGLSALLLLVIISTIGFMLLEDLTLFNSLWMTVISIMTIGYGDLYPVTEEGKKFALVLVPAGAALVTYALGMAATYIIENQLSVKVWNKRMEHAIENLENHIIVCGFGRVGQQVYRQLQEEDVDVLFIHDNEEELDAVIAKGTLKIIGDATDRKILEQAGVKRAKGLIAALRSDADNVFITITAKSLNEELSIVSRAEKEESAEVLKKAGADRVINPSVIGGRELVMSVLKPAGIDYVNYLIHSEEKEFSIEEIVVNSGTALVGKTLAEADVRKQYGVTIVAIKRGDELINNPDSTVAFQMNDIAVAFGNEESIEKFKKAVS